jgi:glycosyltransferase involved in cell wall biosynthesis
MRILLAHNFYQQPGGEDAVYRSECALLESHGHEVARFEVSNEDVKQMSRLSLLSATVWNRAMAARLRDAASAHRAQIVHFHNTFPLMSPAVYRAARSVGASVVQTLHNFRLLCPGANFFRDGNVCEKCLGRPIPLPGAIHKCYRQSRAASSAVVAMLSLHRAIGTYQHAIDAYITPTQFAKAKFVAGGLPEGRIHVKPNFVEPDPGIGAGDGDYAIFVGRLSHEKGLDVLLPAWDRLARDEGSSSRGACPTLKIVGDGPLADSVRAAVARNHSIEWLGRRSSEEVMELIGQAKLLIFPSSCYETFGRTAVEAFARGVPVVASGHGAPGEVVEHGRTGWHFRPGDAEDLAEKIQNAMSDPAAFDPMRIEARRTYETKYTGEINYQMLMEIYEQSVHHHQLG